MATTAQTLAQQAWNAPREGWWDLLRAELTLAPERTARMVRMTLLVMGVVLISMALRVPEAAVSAYMIFFATREDAPGTVRAGIGLIVSVTLAVLVGLVVLSFTDGEPCLRLAAVVTFAFTAMYASRRSSKLGPLGFGVGFVVALILVNVDNVQSPEKLTRSVCWIWVALVYPFALVVLCESIFGDDPEVLLGRGLSRRLVAVASALEAAPEKAGPARRQIERFVRIGTDALTSYAARGPADRVSLRTSLVAEVQALLVLATQLPAILVTSGMQASLRQAAAACLLLSRALLGEEKIEVSPPPMPAREDLSGTDAATLAAILSLLGSVRSLVLRVEQLRDPARVQAAPAGATGTLTSAEQESQRVEAIHFASKVTLAALSAYILYTALDWSGIHTAMITCFFVALETLGATFHKFTLRLTGAVVGGAVGLLSLIFITPRLDSGGGLAVLVGVVTLVAACFATGSQRISYAGWQFAYAFYLVVLYGFERSTKMAGARDRALGIVLGNVLIALVFTHLWPVRVGPKIADGVARALDILADLVSVEAGGSESEARSVQLGQAFFASLSKAQRSAFLARFENGAKAGASMLPMLSPLFLPARALSLWGSNEKGTVQTLPESERWRADTVEALRRTLAVRLREISSAVREGRTPTIHHGKDAFEGPRRSFDAVSNSAVKTSLAPLRLRLEWLGMIGESLETLIRPVNAATSGGGR